MGAKQLAANYWVINGDYTGDQEQMPARLIGNWTLGTLILDGNSEHVAHAKRNPGLFVGEKYPTCGCSRSNQMP